MNKNKTDFINCKNIESFNVIDFFPNVTQKYIPYITNNKGDDMASNPNNSNPDSFFAVLVLPDLIKIPASFQFIFKQTFFTNSDGRLDPNNEFVNLLNRKPTLRKNINYYFYENFNKKWNDGNVKANTNIIPQETLETYRKLLFPSNQNEKIEDKKSQDETEDKNVDKTIDKTEDKKGMATWKIILIIIFVILFIGIIIYLFYKFNLFDKLKNLTESVKNTVALAAPLLHKLKTTNNKTSNTIISATAQINKIPTPKSISEPTQPLTPQPSIIPDNELLNKITQLNKEIEENKAKLNNNIENLKNQIIEDMKEIQKKESTNISS